MSSVRMRVARRLWCASRRRVSQIINLVGISRYSTSDGWGNISLGFTISTRAPSRDSEEWVV